MIYEDIGISIMISQAKIKLIKSNLNRSSLHGRINYSQKLLKNPRNKGGLLP